MTPKRKMLLSMLALLSLFSLLAVGQDNSDEPLTVRLEAGKPQYSFGECITLYVEIENKGTREQIITFSQDLMRSNAKSLTLQMDDSDPRPLSDMYFVSGDCFVLPPQQKLRMRYHGVFVPVGKHRLRITYSYKPDAKEEDGYNRIWRGSVSSNALELTVKDEPMSREARQEAKKRMEKLVAQARKSGKWTRIRLQDHLAYYMPVSRPFMSAMLKDKLPGVRGSTVSSLGVLADKEACDGKKYRHDISLIPEVIELGKKETHPWVKKEIAIVMGKASDSISGETKKGACKLMQSYLDDTSALVAAIAADSYIELAGEKAKAEIKKLLKNRENLSAEHKERFKSVLLEASGKGGMPGRIGDE